jgi:hypothetical protein
LFQRLDARYHDPYGPTMLGALVLVAIGTNFVLRLREF